MESARAVFTCPPKAGPSRRKRSRGKRNKTMSCLSQRLNPDFDPAKHVTQSLHQGNGGKLEGSDSSTASLATDQEPPTTDRQAVSPAFKIQILNTTLKFLKDPHRTILEYPAMSLSEGEFMLSLLEHRKPDTLELGFVSLYAPLNEALKNTASTHELKIKFLETSNVMTMRLMLQKILKRAIENNIHDRREDLNSSTVSQSSVDSERSVKEGRMSNQDVITGLPVAIIQDVLEKVLKFLEDEQMASTEFTNLYEREAAFTQMLPTICRDEKLFNSLSSDCKKLVNRIRFANKAEDWKLDIVLGRINKHNRTRTVRYIKVPTFSRKEKSLRSVVVRKDNPLESQKTNNVNSDLTNLRDNTQNGKKEINIAESPRQKKTQDSQDSRTSERDKQLQETYLKLLNKTKGKKEKKYIAFQSAGLQDIDTNTETDADVFTPSVPPLTASHVGRRLGLSGKQKRILQALNTPFENDRAHRMMRMMGWEGGALGARGEGLTEPIIPALHIRPGAGLGHVKQTDQPNQTSPRSFRIEFLRKLLNFILSDNDSELFTYKEPLSRKEQRFIKPTIVAFNVRKLVGLSSSEEKDLVSRICHEMEERSTLRLALVFNEDNTEFELTKTNGSYVPPTRRRKKTKTKSNVHNLTIEVNNDSLNDSCDVRNDKAGVKNGDSYVRIVNNETEGKNDSTVDSMSMSSVENLAEELIYSGWTPKCAKTASFRVIFLEKLKAFLNSKRENLELHLDNMMSKKNQKYIETVVVEINKKKWTLKTTDIENNIYCEIQKIVGDCYLSIGFGLQKIYLQKKFYQKRFTNSSLTSLPPPVSKDIKKTVIYVNNVPYPAEEVDENILKNNKNIDNSNKNRVRDNKTGENGDIEDDVIDVIQNNRDFIVKNGEIVDKNVDSRDYIVKNCEIVDKPEKNCDNGHQNGDIADKNYDSYGNSFENNKNYCSFDSDDDILVINESIAVEFDSDGEIKINNCDDSTKDSISLDISHDSNVILKNYRNINSKVEVNNNYHVANGKDIDCNNFKDYLDNFEDSNHSSKRSSSISSIHIPKKLKFVKHVAVIHKDNSHITAQEAELIQNLISNSIDETLPLLECHGIQNGGLIYSCHSQKSYEWLANIFNLSGQIKLVDAEMYENNHKLQLKINSFVKYDTKKVFNLLELYNNDLVTDKWVVLNERYNENCILITVNVDDVSFRYISEKSFSLFAGIDKVKFSFVWD